VIVHMKAKKDATRLLSGESPSGPATFLYKM
jgi:hypothetical protein